MQSTRVPEYARAAGHAHNTIRGACATGGARRRACIANIRTDLNGGASASWPTLRLRVYSQ
eukprot:7473245-Heterocapsa_arctica.AAC.1